LHAHDARDAGFAVLLLCSTLLNRWSLERDADLVISGVSD